MQVVHAPAQTRPQQVAELCQLGQGDEPAEHHVDVTWFAARPAIRDYQFQVADPVGSRGAMAHSDHGRLKMT